MGKASLQGTESRCNSLFFRGQQRTKQAGLINQKIADSPLQGITYSPTQCGMFHELLPGI